MYVQRIGVRKEVGGPFRYKEVAHPHRKRESKYKPVAASKWDLGQNGEAGDGDASEKKGGDAAEDRAWNCQNDSAYFTENTHENQKATATVARSAIRNTSNANHTRILSKYLVGVELSAEISNSEAYVHS